MNILVACEESQKVCKAFRDLGHNAFSCDLIPCSGGHPEWHIQYDVTDFLNGFNVFETQDGKPHFEVMLSKWDLIVAFPPCTFLTTTGNRWFNVDKYGWKAIERMKNRRQAIDFFLKIANADCDHIVIENPVGIMSTVFRKPDQIIQPYMFGDPYEKRTCLWLKNLKPLVPENQVEPPERVKFESGRSMPKWYADAWHMNPKERAIFRSKTFDGIAKAIAIQFSKQISEEKELVK